jgi:hypothetical protein
VGSIEELVAGIRRVRSLVGRARQAVALAELRITAAGEAFGAATTGSAVSEPAEASGHHAFAARRTAETLATLTAVVDRLDRYLEGLGATTAPARSGHPASTHPIAPVPPERIEALRDELPETVVRGSGQKTHGRWVGPDGVAHEIVSGRDEDSAAALQVLRTRGLPLRSEPAAISHVEQKLAALMVRSRVRHATLVINNRPCRGPAGCDTFVPVILPNGYSLTIYAPGYRKTFTGGASPSWR